MVKLKALTCSTFLNAIRLLDGHVGCEFNGQVVIAAWKGSGYISAAKGPRFSFKARGDEEMVTVLEIEASLKHLGWSAQAFVDMIARMEESPPPPKDPAVVTAKK